MVFPPVSSPAMPAVDWKRLWSLNADITYLNHGAYGACPTAVLNYQQQLRSQLESEPVQFLGVELEPLLDASRQTLAQFVQAQPEDLVFVPNATTGVNAVLRSLRFTSDDELLTTDHEYNASRNALNFAAARGKARVRVATVPFPLVSAEQVIEAVLSQVSRQTRLVLLDHVTSQTALIYPIAELVQALNDRGIDTLVDGAHAPGMIPLNLEKLGATYYTGNCHKWLCSPKGAGFLYVRRDRQEAIRPLVISHGANSPRSDRPRFHLEFDWMGTDDPTAYLCVGESIRYLGSLLPGGWSALMEHNRTLARTARRVLCSALNVKPPSPDGMLGAIATIPLPGGHWEHLQTALFRRHRIEVPIFPWQGTSPGLPNRLLRLSAQLYNTLADYDDLAAALVTLLANEETETP